MKDYKDLGNIIMKQLEENYNIYVIINEIELSRGEYKCSIYQEIENNGILSLIVKDISFISKDEISSANTVIEYINRLYENGYFNPHKESLVYELDCCNNGIIMAEKGLLN